MQSDYSLVNQSLKEFEALTRRYAFFHILFFVIFVLELLTLLVLILFFAKSVGAAIAVAAIFLTVFTYFVLRFYLDTKKPEQLISLRDKFLKKEVLQRTEGWSVEMVYPIYQLIQKLQGKESQYRFSLFQTAMPLVEKFSIWCHWDDVHWMKETLHLHALRKLLDRVKLYPTDIELHKTLAGAYSALYPIYHASSSAKLHPFVMHKFQSAEMRDRFEKAARAAIEELKIVLNYLPEEAWALGQIAKVYHDLDLKQEERKIYETLLKIKPHDSEIHYQLGRLYFELGEMAQGLLLYQELQEMEDPKAQELIEHYDAYHLD